MNKTESIVVFQQKNIVVQVMLEHEKGIAPNSILDAAADELTLTYDIDVRNLGDWAGTVVATKETSNNKNGGVQ